LLRKTVSGIVLLSLLFLSSSIIALNVKADGYLEIVEPSEGFSFSKAFEVTFRITNIGSETIEFVQGDYSNRIDLEVEFESWGVLLWSTAPDGLTLAPGEFFYKTLKCEVGVYYGSLIIRLAHWTLVDGTYKVGSLGKVEVKGAAMAIVTEADIGFYGLNSLHAELADYLKGLGYSVTYVNCANFASVKLVYLDYRCSPPQEELLDYVNNGGNLWISGEAVDGAEINFLGAIISEDSIEFWGSSDDPSRLWLRNHALTNEVSSIVYPAGAWLQISGNIKDIIQIDGKTILAIDESHKGKILWLIDSDVFGRGFLYQEDNEILAKNIVSWALPPPKLTATVDICPKALNLRSRGRWITSYIELPEGYNVEDINVSTIMLNGTIPVESRPIAIGDYDEDGIPDLMVKFDRARVISYIFDNIGIVQLLEERFMTVTLTIAGKLYDGIQFQGSDTLRIIMPMPRCSPRCLRFMETLIFPI